MTVEIFRHIQGYEGLYKVSNLGRVYSIRRKGFLSPSINRYNGRRTVFLCRYGKARPYAIARVVAEAFIGPANGQWVLHWDDNAGNDRLTNLRYGTRAENVEDMIRNGKAGSGENHPHAKLTEDQVREIKQRLANGHRNGTALAAEYGMAQQTIGHIKSGYRWSHVN